MIQRWRINVPATIAVTTITSLSAAFAHQVFPAFYGQSSVLMRALHGFIVAGLLVSFVQYIWQTRFGPNRFKPDERMKLRLTGSPQERMTLLMFSLITLVFSGFMFHIFLTNTPAEEGWGGIRIVMTEIYFTFALFGLYGLVWSIMTPRWLERALRTTVRQVLFFVFTLVAAGILSVIYLYMAE